MLDDDEEEKKPEVPFDPAITEELIRAWRHPRPGSSNPERMNNPVWEWLIKSRVNAYQAADKFNVPASSPPKPVWCFDRFGQSTTKLPDGRKVLIAGEHEDSYDPDFYIYNDVVVIDPAGDISIYGYPHAVFPATDFHSATLLDNRIIIIGSLGYPRERKPGTTPVFALDLTTFSISPIITTGTPPGWLFEHTATLMREDVSIIVKGGKLDKGRPATSLEENLDTWKLHPADWRWERVDGHHWPRCDFFRSDGDCNQLWLFRQALFAQSVKWEKELGEHVQELKDELGIEPDLDLAARLYRPGVPHEPLPSLEDHYNYFRVRVEGVTVRFVEEMDCITMTVEGELPPEVIDALATDFVAKLSALENTPYTQRRF